MKRIMKIVKSLGDSSLLIKGATCYSNNCKTKKGIKEDDFSVCYWHTRCNFIDKYVDRQRCRHAGDMVVTADGGVNRVDMME